MNIWELFILATALAMDAFAVAICVGLSLPKFKLWYALVVGMYFGVFQAIMPLVGFFVGYVFAERITGIDNYVVFVVLAILGGRMIYGSIKKEESHTGERNAASVLVFSSMIPLAFATSIDALAAGVSFAFLRVEIIPAVILVGVVTFIFSAIGVKLGKVAGTKLKSHAELVGGIVLIAIGIKNLFS